MKPTLLDSLLDLLFPPLCHLCRCHLPSAGELHLCPACFERLSLIRSPHCTICGIPFEGAGIDHRCGACCSAPPHFDSARAPYRYDGGIKELLHNFKYTPRPLLRKPLALLITNALTEHVRALAVDVIVPVPLHSKRLRQRGFNQAVLLGERLAAAWQIPMQRELLRRIRWTEPQVNLSAEERRVNVKGAFELHDRGDVAGRMVLLVDDVFTTGSTANECSRVLKAAGAREVHSVTVARA